MFIKKDWTKFNELENNLALEPVSYSQNIKVFEELFKFATKIGVLPSLNPLESSETKIKVTKILNGIRKNN